MECSTDSNRPNIAMENSRATDPKDVAMKNSTEPNSMTMELSTDPNDTPMESLTDPNAARMERSTVPNNITLGNFTGNEMMQSWKFPEKQTLKPALSRMDLLLII